MRRGALILAAAAVVLAGSCGVLVSPLLLLMGLLASAAIVLSVRRTLGALVIATVAVCLIPVYYARPFGGSAALATLPVVVAGVLLLPAALSRAAGLRVVPLDVAVGLYLAAQSTAYLLTLQTGPGAALGLLLRVGLPYGVWRLLARDERAPLALAKGIVAVGAVLSAQAVTERSEGNPFFTLVRPVYQAAQWARPELRFGQVRVESSFGHPIAFGLFLALVVTLGVALLQGAGTSRGRLALALVLVLVAVALVETQSRGPLLVAVAAVMLTLLRGRRAVSPRALVAGAVVVGALLVLGPQAGEVQTLVTASTASDSREAASADYRGQVAGVLLDPAAFSVLGTAAGGQTSIAGNVGSVSSLKSVDDQFVLTYLAGGLLSLLALVNVGVLVIRAAIRLPTRDPVVVALGAALACTVVSLASVALLTQQGDLFWVSIAVLAACDERLRPRFARAAAASPHEGHENGSPASVAAEAAAAQPLGADA